MSQLGVPSFCFHLLYDPGFDPLQRVVQINTKYMYESGLRVFTSMSFALRQIQVSPATKLSKEREEIKNNEKGKYFFLLFEFYCHIAMTTLGNLSRNAEKCKIQRD